MAGWPRGVLRYIVCGKGAGILAVWVPITLQNGSFGRVRDGWFWGQGRGHPWTCASVLIGSALLAVLPGPVGMWECHVGPRIKVFCIFADHFSDTRGDRGPNLLWAIKSPNGQNGSKWLTGGDMLVFGGLVFLPKGPRPADCPRPKSKKVISWQAYKASSRASSQRHRSALYGGASI